MVRVRAIIAGLSLVLMSGCSGGTKPPVELDGLWSASAPACAAGVGVRFRANAIEAVYRNDHQTLFAQPRYAVESAGEDFRVRITYQLPQIAGGVRTAGAHGVIILVRRADGIAPEAHNLIDPRTGAARLRIDDDPATTALTLQPCGTHPWRRDEGLRGRAA